MSALTFLLAHVWVGDKFYSNIQRLEICFKIYPLNGLLTTLPLPQNSTLWMEWIHGKEKGYIIFLPEAFGFDVWLKWPEDLDSCLKSRYNIQILFTEFEQIWNTSNILFLAHCYNKSKAKKKYFLLVWTKEFVFCSDSEKYKTQPKVL